MKTFSMVLLACVFLGTAGSSAQALTMTGCESRRDGIVLLQDPVQGIQSWSSGETLVVEGFLLSHDAAHKMIVGVRNLLCL